MIYSPLRELHPHTIGHREPKERSTDLLVWLHGCQTLVDPRYQLYGQLGILSPVRNLEDAENSALEIVSQIRLPLW